MSHRQTDWEGCSQEQELGGNLVRERGSIERELGRSPREEIGGPVAVAALVLDDGEELEYSAAEERKNLETPWVPSLVNGGGDCLTTSGTRAADTCHFSRDTEGSLARRTGKFDRLRYAFSGGLDENKKMSPVSQYGWLNSKASRSKRCVPGEQQFP
ncbi:hypothetical protein N9F48_01955 [Akkermansiaceae bacterium]|nr:hypothetical protein [Akkermansiaceae bacterium]